MRLLTFASKKQSRRLRWLHRAVAALPLCGCQGVQSVLDPHGSQAQAIARIAWIMFWGTAAVLLLVMTLALYAVYRRPDKGRAPRTNLVVAAGGVALPVVTLSALLVYGVDAMNRLRPPPATETPITVIAHRWWWEVQYRDEDGRVVATANEIHIPVGKPVPLSLETRDVIHSFWVPSLAGKIDAIPGRANRIVLHAERPGVYRGQCAEYCGAQHARMAFHVVAQEAEAHAAWLAAQAAPARTPADPLPLRGRDVFLAHCTACHTVRGLSTARERGPDLTHVAGRAFLAAGILPNNRDNLAAFIAHSQAIKPGNGMPSYPHLDEATLHALARYLESLR